MQPYVRLIAYSGLKYFPLYVISGERTRLTSEQSPSFTYSSLRTARLYSAQPCSGLTSRHLLYILSARWSRAMVVPEHGKEGKKDFLKESNVILLYQTSSYANFSSFMTKGRGQGRERTEGFSLISSNNGLNILSRCWFLFQYHGRRTEHRLGSNEQTEFIAIVHLRKLSLDAVIVSVARQRQKHTPSFNSVALIREQQQKHQVFRNQVHRVRAVQSPTFSPGSFARKN